IAPYRQFLLLASKPGWRATAADLTADAAGAYALDALPGDAAPIPKLTALSEEQPIALAKQKDGPLHVLCERDARIRLAPTGCETHITVLPGVGGEGWDERHFSDPQDLALLEHGWLAVADAEAGSVKVFSAFPYALLAVWPGLGQPTRLAADD